MPGTLNFLHYQEYSPSPDLKNIIECYWAVCLDANAVWDFNRPLVPDGCIDLLFNLRGYAEYSSRQERIFRQEMGIILGAQTIPCYLKPYEDIYCFGVRFRPGKAYLFLEIPSHEFTNHFVLFEEVCGDFAKRIKDKFLSSPFNPHFQILLIEKEIRKRIHLNYSSLKWIESAIHFIDQSNGQITTEKLSEKLGITRQHLARLFLKHAGITPKIFNRIVRLQEVLRKLAGEECVDWCDLALECGYYDQSHLIADFIEFTGLNPSQYLIDGYHKFHFSNTFPPVLFK